MKEFKYDVLKLIDGVRERPCIWDKKLEAYKDRYGRRKAWQEIFNILDDEYESMSPEVQRMAGEVILNKWTNIRDTFVKSLRAKDGRPRRKYVLHEQLQFLTNQYTDETNQYTEDPSNEYSEVCVLKEEPEELPRKRKNQRVEDFAISATNDAVTSQSTRKRSKKKEIAETVEVNNTQDYEINNDIDFVEVAEVNATMSDHRLMNEDEAFFASLLPTVVRFSEDERLEFRIEVLGVMRRIKENRKWSGIEES